MKVNQCQKKMDRCDPANIPLLWINLDTAMKRRARMNWAINQGGWKACRFSAIDAADRRQRLVAIPNLLRAGIPLPGLYRAEEADSMRITSRHELACLASWKHLLIKAKKTETPSGWVLLMEDDVGASLATPDSWAHSLLDLIDFCPKGTVLIQLAPISADVRHSLANLWFQSHGSCLSVSKETIRSHGNGAVLLNKEGIDRLIDRLLLVINRLKKNWHPFLYPWLIRPVADKWIYGSLPHGSCQVATYPHFCLEAEESSLHIKHVESYHKPSRRITLSIWERDKREEMLRSQLIWDSITN